MHTRPLAALGLSAGLAAALVACSAPEDDNPVSDAMESASTSEGEATINTPSEQPPATTAEATPVTETVVVTETVEGASGGACDPAVFGQALGFEVAMVYCDSTVATVGRPQTDHIVHMAWDGAQWQTIAHDGESFTGFPCYNEQKLYDYGFPPERVEQMITCE